MIMLNFTCVGKIFTGQCGRLAAAGAGWLAGGGGWCCGGRSWLAGGGGLAAAGGWSWQAGGGGLARLAVGWRQAGRRAAVTKPHCSADSLNAFHVFVLIPATRGSSRPCSPSHANHDRPSMACCANA